MGRSIQGRRSYNVFLQLPNNPQFLPPEQQFQGKQLEIFQPLDWLCKSLLSLLQQNQEICKFSSNGDMKIIQLQYFLFVNLYSAQHKDEEIKKLKMQTSNI